VDLKIGFLPTQAVVTERSVVNVFMS